MKFDLARAERLRQARRAAGLPSASEAARRHGWSISSYCQHENADRGFPLDKAAAYARAFRVSLPWLLFGQGAPHDAHVPLYGAVGAGDAVEPVVSDPPEQVEGPGWLAEGAAVSVRGDSMQPAYRPGDTIYFSRRTVPLAALLGGIVYLTSKLSS